MVRDNEHEGNVLIRARVREDLDNLRSTYLTTLSPTTHRRDRDYPYRARATHDELAVAMARIAHDVLYENFKSEVARKQGWPRERLYSKIWSVMFDAERKLEEDEANDRKRARLLDDIDVNTSYPAPRFDMPLAEQASMLRDSIDGVPAGRIDVLGGKTKKKAKKK